MEMGFGQHASEKALFMTMSKGQSVENALEWIGEHSEDPDFNEQLFMVGPEGEGELKKEYQGNLSKEERIRIAEEKIKAARQKREEEKKINDFEMEKNRILNQKMMGQARRLNEEKEAELALLQRKKEKEEFQKAKFAMQIQLERDRCERKGIPFDESKALETIKQKEKRPPLEEIKHGIKTVKTLYTEERQPGVCKTCLKTISVYTGNVVKDPNEPKFQSINLANEAFQKRVGKINGGLGILKGFGFEVDNEQNKLVLKKYDADLFKKGIELLQNEL